jgi:hypothetical protein
VEAGVEGRRLTRVVDDGGSEVNELDAEGGIDNLKRGRKSVKEERKERKKEGDERCSRP